MILTKVYYHSNNDKCLLEINYNMFCAKFRARLSIFYYDRNYEKHYILRHWNDNNIPQFHVRLYENY